MFKEKFIILIFDLLESKNSQDDEEFLNQDVYKINN